MIAELDDLELDHAGFTMTEAAAEKLCLILSQHRHTDWTSWRFKARPCGGAFIHYTRLDRGGGFTRHGDITIEGDGEVRA